MENFNKHIGRITNNIQKLIQDISEYVIEENPPYEKMSTEQKAVMIKCLRYLVMSRDSLSNMPD